METATVKKRVIKLTKKEINRTWAPDFAFLDREGFLVWGEVSAVLVFPGEQPYPPPIR